VPVVIAVAAVVVVVGIVVYVTSETADAPPLVTALPIASAVPTSTATAVPRLSDKEREAICWPIFMECLENQRQPRNTKTWGNKKDCGACLRECKNHTNGDWPDKKCPRK
jgi:hypothetical protein